MKVRGGIAGYFRHIGNILAPLRFVKSQNVYTEKRTPTEGFLRGDVIFKDDSRLHFRELVSTELSVQLVSYTYQYMRADGTTIFRYDDADHFLSLPTSPHHKHIGENKVVAANKPDLQAILQEIERMIKA